MKNFSLHLENHTDDVLLIYNFLNKSWESIDNVNNVDLSGATFSSFEFTKLLVAGKGHEKIQDYGDKKFFFSDKKAILKSINYKNKSNTIE